MFPVCDPGLSSDEPQTRMGQDRGLFADSADASPAARSTDWTLRGKLRGHFLCRFFSRCRNTAWMLRSICADITPSMTWTIPRTLRRLLRGLPTGRTPDDSCPRGNLLRGLRGVIAWTLPGCFPAVCASLGRFSGHSANGSADVARQAALSFDKGMVSHKTERLSIPESRKR